jgi:hypothetical protein
MAPLSWLNRADRWRNEFAINFRIGALFIKPEAWSGLLQSAGRIKLRGRNPATFGHET